MPVIPVQNHSPIEASLAEQMNSLLKCVDLETREQLLDIVTEGICLSCLEVIDGRCYCSDEE